MGIETMVSKLKRGNESQTLYDRLNDLDASRSLSQAISLAPSVCVQVVSNYA